VIKRSKTRSTHGFIFSEGMFAGLRFIARAENKSVIDIVREDMIFPYNLLLSQKDIETDHFGIRLVRSLLKSVMK
jgi:hypothetical protein